MDYGIYDFSRPYINGEERILWKGQPEKGNIITGNNIFSALFGVIFLAFSIFWTLGASKASAPFSFFGIPFICAGAYLTFGRFIHTVYLRKNTAYVITDKKIIRRRGQKIDMLELKNLPSVQVYIHKNGNGTVAIGDPVYYNGYGRRRNVHVDPYEGRFTIENIKDIAQVQKILSEAER